jgi:hypothetical protein
LFAGELWLSYGQFHLWGEHAPEDDALTFGDQRNGLLGAAQPDALALKVGLHTGAVPLTVELHPGPPPLDLSWEEVVEATWVRPPGSRTECLLMGLLANSHHPVALPPVDHRARFSASGMDAAHQADTRGADEPVIDRYLLQLWPAAPGGSTDDAVIKQTSGAAAYWHGIARELPPLAETVRVRAEHAEQQRLERERRRAASVDRAQRVQDQRMWGGPRPAAPLGELIQAAQIARLDLPLATAIADASPDQQRRITWWLLRRGLVRAGVDHIGWLTAGVDAVEHGDPLPTVFTDHHGNAAVDLLFRDTRIIHTRVWSMDGSTDEYSGQIGALCALQHAGDPDPAVAVFVVLNEVATTFGGQEYPALFSELRAAFPSLRS